MMTHRTYPTFDAAYRPILRDLLENGKKVSPRGQNCFEIINYGFTIEDATDPTLIYCGLLERQEVYDKYRESEIQWYLSGNLSAESAPSKFWLKLANEAGLITSNYGHMMLYDYKIPYGDDWLTSLQYVVKTLQNDKDSRQAIAHYGDPTHFWEGNKDLPCSIAQQFFIRDGKLECITTMRSNDVWIGTPYDVAWFCYFMNMVASLLEVPVGRYHHNVGSMHLYEKNLEDAKKEAYA
jgi:thymidylate synthase